ncbi:hypothetical protein FAP94_18960 [Morganella morganii]|nr:hypothetical protein [Morganella morganii]
MARMPIRFRAIHTINRWRKAAHENFANATTVGNRSALALFEHRNDAINYTKQGEPLYVVVWNNDEESQDGVVIRHKPITQDGLQYSIAVSRSIIVRWEKGPHPENEELDQYFSSSPELHGLPSDIETLEQFNQYLTRVLEDSAKLSAVERAKRLAQASPVPKRIQLTTSAFARNPDVIVEVLARANGVCENCRNVAPFQRARDGSPYLEVHHINPLSAGGDDTVSNALALCPNCHRYLHFGISS